MTSSGSASGEQGFRARGRGSSYGPNAKAAEESELVGGGVAVEYEPVGVTTKCQEA